MKKALFYLGYLLTPAVPASLYARATGGGATAYGFSVVLGVAALVFLFNQLILASRPRFAVAALGLKPLVAFHGAMGAMIPVLGLAHRLLKARAGFPLTGAQAILGLAGWLLVVAGALAAIALLAPAGSPLMSWATRLRAALKERLGLDYRRSRALHNLMVAAAAGLAAHAALASSSGFSFNPIGAAWLGAWGVLALALYARYRLRGRKAPNG